MGGCSAPPCVVCRVPAANLGRPGVPNPSHQPLLSPPGHLWLRLLHMQTCARDWRNQLRSLGFCPDLQQRRCERSRCETSIRPRVLPRFSSFYSRCFSSSFLPSLPPQFRTSCRRLRVHKAAAGPGPHALRLRRLCSRLPAASSCAAVIATWSEASLIMQKGRFNAPQTDWPAATE